jgi:hypothetical protein
MDKIFKRASERLAEQPSRRGFFSVLGKAVLGAAGLIAGQSFFAQEADAASIKCCKGTPCATGACPSTAPHNNYTWSCGHFFCHDCYTTTTGGYVCTYVATT